MTDLITRVREAIANPPPDDVLFPILHEARGLLHIHTWKISRHEASAVLTMDRTWARCVECTDVQARVHKKNIKPTFKIHGYIIDYTDPCNWWPLAKEKNINLSPMVHNEGPENIVRSAWVAGWWHRDSVIKKEHQLVGHVIDKEEHRAVILAWLKMWLEEKECIDAEIKPKGALNESADNNGKQ